MPKYKIIEEYYVEEWYDGDKEWFLDGKLHRINGPAIEYSNGDKEWFLNGKLHRINGPAIELHNGSKFWYFNGKLHRINGAAIEWYNGDKYWYLDGIEYTKKEYYKELVKRNLITEKQAFIELI